MTKDETIARALLDAASASIIPTLVGSILLLATNYLSSPNGSVSIGEPIKIQGSESLYILPIDIVSYRDDSKLAVSFEVDPPLRMSAISSSRPVALSEVATGGYSDKQLLQVEDIPREARTRLFVKTASTPIKTLVSVRNAGEAKLLVDRDYAVKTKTQVIFEGLPIQVFFFFVISFAATFVFDRLFLRPLREGLVRSRNDASDLRELAEKYKDAGSSAELELKKIKADFQDERDAARRERLKVRCLLISRISDLRKELDFWRDTLRSYVVHTGIPRENAEQLLKLIPEKLNTWSTLSGEQDLLSIRVAASMFERGADHIADADLKLGDEIG
jgi:hypothetical protein